LPHVDYVVADKFVFPEELKSHFSEEPLYLDTVFQVSDSKRVIGPEKPRSFYGLPEDKFVFCSFNNAYKYTPEVINTWAEILNQCPDAILWLLEDNQWSKVNLLAEFKKNGVDAERIHFAGRIPPEDYLARFKCADLFLDTFPYNAGTTANDALFAGLPVLTLSGKTYVSRMAGALLTRQGRTELISYSVVDYVQSAVMEYRNNFLNRYILSKNAYDYSIFDTNLIVENFEMSVIKIFGIKR
jgi:predicted O-linked N-acetylglucosamine transferase (SPINDLY family)